MKDIIRTVPKQTEEQGVKDTCPNLIFVKSRFSMINENQWFSNRKPWSYKYFLNYVPSNALYPAGGLKTSNEVHDKLFEEKVTLFFFFFFFIPYLTSTHTLQVVIINYSSNINKLLISLIKIDGCCNLKYFSSYQFHYSLLSDSILSTSCIPHRVQSAGQISQVK